MKNKLIHNKLCSVRNIIEWVKVNHSIVVYHIAKDNYNDITDVIFIKSTT